jgi:HSP20 family protein
MEVVAMALIPWGKGKNGGEVSWVNDLRSEMDRVFERYLRDPLSSVGESFGFTGQFAPSLDVSETANEVTVQAELPGVDPKDLDITVTGERLTISGEKREESEQKDKNFHQREIRSGSFSRTIQLPAGADPQQVSAEHKNGTLTIRIKKTEQAAARKINVKTT